MSVGCDRIKMKNNVCPLCATCNDFQENNRHYKQHSNLQQIIQKHLQIEINENRIPKVCSLCKQTVIEWDRFAEKCWGAQNILNGQDVKLEESSQVEIKIEQTLEDYKNDDEDDKYSLLDNSKNEDPLLDNMKPNFQSTAKKKSFKKNNKKASKRRRISTDSYDDEINSDILLSEIKAENDTLVEDAQEKNVKKSSKKKSTIIDYNCYVCGSKTSGWAFLVRHFSEEHPSSEVKVLCVCGKYLFGTSSIYRHINMHDEKRGFKCDQCDRKFTCNRTYKEHMLVHFPNMGYNYSCPHCPKKFYMLELFKNHTKKHLPPELKNTVPCDICGEKLTSKSNLKAHKISKHENVKEHVCDICGQAFKTKGNMICHKDIHNVEKNFACDKCPKKFKSKDLLKRHSEVHIDKKLKCPLCPAVLKSKNSFRAHKDIHNNVYRYTCHLCGKKLRKSNHLKVHMNTHEGVKSFICQWCSKQFSSNQNLDLHISKAHPHVMVKSSLSKIAPIHGDRETAYSENSLISEFSE